MRATHTNAERRPSTARRSWEWILRLSGIALISLAAVHILVWWTIPVVGIPLVIDALALLGKSMR